MKKIQMTLLAGLMLSMATPLQALAADNIPKGWFKAGSHPKEYEIAVEKKILSIKNLEKDPDGFTTLMQSIQANKFKGKRVRLSANAKSLNLNKGWAGLWMRIDGKGGNILGFDNMSKRPIKGTTDWKSYSVVLDIPAESENIAFGILSSGAGQVWVKDIKFDVVDKSVKTTNMNISDNNAEPENLELK